MAQYVIVGRSLGNITEEKTAAEVITPGMLIELNASGNYLKHATAGGTAFPCFALRNKYEGDTYTDDYSSDDELFAWYPTPGDIVVNAILDGNSVNISIGDPLESAGNGHLRKAEASSAGISSYSKNIVGFALEAVTSDGARAEIQVG